MKTVNNKADGIKNIGRIKGLWAVKYIDKRQFNGKTQGLIHGEWMGHRVAGQ